MAKAKLRRAKPRSAPRGPRGRTGHVGPQGARGPAGKNHAIEIAALSSQIAELVSGLQAQTRQTASLSAQVAELLKELQVQLTRIGQMQVQLDHLTRGQAIEPRDRRITDRTNH